MHITSDTHPKKFAGCAEIPEGLYWRADYSITGRHKLYLIKKRKYLWDVLIAQDIFTTFFRADVQEEMEAVSRLIVDTLEAKLRKQQLYKTTKDFWK